MKKIISLILALTFFCSAGITVIATNNETVGGKITLTQFIGIDRHSANSVQLYTNGRVYTVDKEAFYNIADSMIITSNIELYTITNDGIYICVKTDEDTAHFIYLSSAGIDKITPSAGREIYSLYIPDEISQIDNIISLADETSVKKSDWAVEEIERAKELKIIPDGFAITDYTQAITREGFCELAASMVEAKTDRILPVENPQYPLGIIDTSNENVRKLYSAGIVNGRVQNKTRVKFAPYELITREEAATMLQRIAVYMGMDIPQISDTVYYNDEDTISDWAYNAVRIMRQMNIMKGMSVYEFAPKASYTVEQAIATMARMFEQ